MKKLLSLLFIAIALVLPACNDDDASENDGLYTQKLIGTWQYSNTYDDKEASISIVLNANGNFVYNSSEVDLKNPTMKMWTVPGAWNVQRGVLQLRYDLDQFRATGLSESEVSNVTYQLKSSNSILETSNKEGKTFGYGINFETVNGKEVLYLSGINGYFQRLK